MNAIFAVGPGVPIERFRLTAFSAASNRTEGGSYDLYQVGSFLQQKGYQCGISVSDLCRQEMVRPIYMAEPSLRMMRR